MRAFEIFKTGKHTSSAGATLSFSEADLQAAVAAYDPAVHEAPIVVGHPKDNAPAYGWVKSLSFADGAITAEPDQVDPAFDEMVQAGRFKKRSASFYSPDSPNNPKPGTYYLRHVGFLGAQAPAVKGLKDVSFSESEGVIEFGDFGYAGMSIARLFRGIREWIIANKSIDDADKVVPDYLISDIEAEARRSDSVSAYPPAFSEEEMTITKEQHEALQQQLKTAQDAEKAAKDELAKKTAEFSEREKAFAERDAKHAQAAVAAEFDQLVKDGKVLPNQREQMVAFAMSLNDSEMTFDFKEGDKVEKVSQRTNYLRTLKAGPQIVDYTERSFDANGKEKPDTIADMNNRLTAQVAGGGAK